MCKGFWKTVNRTQFLSSIRSLINYHRICGVGGYHLTGDIQKGIDALGVDRTFAGGKEQKALSAVPKAEIRKVEAEVEKTVTGAANIGALSSEINVCQKCSLQQGRQVSTAGKGGSSPLLLIVGDWLTVSAGVVPVPGDLFGKTQDSMLAKMIAAISLNEEDVFITNVIKCSLPDSCQPTMEHIKTCGTYLTDQIALLSPRLICSMGIIASRLLTGRSQPLSQQRGRFVTYSVAPGKSIPLMPTYHPTFLLQNPEMKQAAWADLQAIEKKIRELKG